MKRSRLLILAVTLVLTIGAFATTPATAATPATAGNPTANAQWICEDGCWAWDIENGCTQEVTCCANEGGSWFCILW